MDNNSELMKIEGLARCYKENHLMLSVLERIPELTEWSLREIEFCANTEAGDMCCTVIVFDEYDDAEIQNPVLWLHLVIDTCNGYEEAQDYNEWRLNEGYPDTDYFKSLYQSYSVIVPEIRKIIGDVETIGLYHIEFNTSITQALREYRL